jgi:hypothetical protein
LRERLATISLGSGSGFHAPDQFRNERARSGPKDRKVNTGIAVGKLVAHIVGSPQFGTKRIVALAKPGLKQFPGFFSENLYTFPD